MSFQSCCISCLENNTALVCYIFDTHQPMLIIFVDNHTVLLSTVCKYFWLAISFSKHGIQYDWKDTVFGVHVSPRSAETLVMRSGITHRLIAYSQRHLSQWRCARVHFRVWGSLARTSAAAEIARDARNGHTRSFKVIRCCANRYGIYDFLLALNSKLTSTFNRSWDIA